MALRRRWLRVTLIGTTVLVALVGRRHGREPIRRSTAPAAARHLHRPRGRRPQGRRALRDHVLTVGSHGRINGQVTAKTIVVLGHVTGNLIATEKVDIKESGSVEGDIVAPRVAIADGSHFRGTIDMQPRDQPKPDIRKPEPSSVNGELARV